METQEVADLRVSQECLGWREMTWMAPDMETTVWVQRQEPMTKPPWEGAALTPHHHPAWEVHLDLSLQEGQCGRAQGKPPAEGTEGHTQH